MVRLELSGALLERLERAGWQRPTGEEEQPFVEHQVLVDLARRRRELKGVDQELYTLAQLLKLTGPYAPPPPERQRSAELEKILAGIALEQEKAEYERMTKGLGAASSNGLFGAGAASSSEQDLGLKMSADERAEWDAAKRELSAIINVLASMIGIGVAVYMVGGGYALGTRVGLALGGAFAIGAIEAYLYYRAFTRGDSKKQQPPSRQPLQPQAVPAALKSKMH